MSKDKNPKNNQPDDAKGGEQQDIKPEVHAPPGDASDSVGNGDDVAREDHSAEEDGKKTGKPIPSSEEKDGQKTQNPEEITADEKTSDSKENDAVEKEHPSVKKQGQYAAERAKLGIQAQIGGDAYFLNNTVGTQDDTKPGHDPLADAKPFLDDSGSRLSLAEEELVIAEQKLTEERYLIIDCDDRDFAFFATKTLLDRVNPEKNKERRLLEKFGDTASPNMGTDLGVFLDATERGTGDFILTINLIHYSDSVVTDFLRPLATNEARVFIDQLTSTLRGRNHYWLILCRPVQAHRARIAHEVPRWQVDALKGLLEQYFPNNYSSLLPKLQEQIKEGCWGSGNSYGAVRSVARNGRLDKLITQYDKTGGCTGDENTIRQLITSNEVEGEVIRAVLFAAGFFPEVSVKGFEKLIDVFLGERTAQKEHEEEILNQEGQTIKRKVEQEVPLKSLWREKRQAIFSSCHLLTASSAERGKVIAFSEPHFQQEVRDGFSELDPFYLPERFEELRHSELLFDESSQVARNIVDFMTLMVVDNPEDYGSQWLAQWAEEKFVEYAGERVQGEAAKIQAIEKEDIQGMVKAGVWNTLSDLNRAQFVSRLASLVRELQNHSRLENLAEDFVAELFKNHSIANALAFIQQLWLAPKFRTLHWLKRLIAEYPSPTSDDAAKILWQFLKKRVRQEPDLLAEMLSWIRNDDPKEITVLERAALPIFPRLCSDSIRAVKRERYGKVEAIPPITQGADYQPLEPVLRTLLQGLCHPLQRACSIEGQFVGTKTPVPVFYLARLIKEHWLQEIGPVIGHHHITEQVLDDWLSGLDKLLEDLDANQEAVIALLIVEWLAILQGLPSDLEKQEKTWPLLDWIIAELRGHLSKKQQQKLLRFVSRFRNVLRGLVSKVRELDRSTARPLAARRELLGWFAERWDR
uniref:Uncharacterized protein n=1 Tax=Candidatus Kentrum sp. UNK TaxID=2126344 RepID=A0A451AVX8_9GAMM|nr:MAG: hypothetical protein BECKUNK1418G_GA0071005_10207 [Candidatus Kentron sp. UNK]VFK70047.1 MAG: hypothetical protein BECKUNK1418H_GA0071006_10237 [Candidatus Kentron sp. UNK]